MFADVYFVVHDETIPAHRVILAARSAYFAQMLRTKWQEKTVFFAKSCKVRSFFQVVHELKFTTDYNLHWIYCRFRIGDRWKVIVERGVSLSLLNRNMLLSMRSRKGDCKKVDFNYFWELWVICVPDLFWYLKNSNSYLFSSLSLLRLLYINDSLLVIKVNFGNGSIKMLMDIHLRTLL